MRALFCFTMVVVRRMFESVLSMYVLARLLGVGKGVKILACAAMGFSLWKVSSLLIPYVKKPAW